MILSMFSSKKRINLLNILILIFVSSLAFGQACTDKYGGAASLAAAEASLVGLTDCLDGNQYACYGVFKSLYKADFDVVSAINDAISDGCINCDPNAFNGLAARIQAAYDRLAAIGYPKYNSGLPILINSWNRPQDLCANQSHHPLNGPNIAGRWEGKADNGMTTIIDIKLDKVNERYLATINPGGAQSFTSTLQYTSETELFAANWNSTAYVYDDAIVWEGQVWRKKSASLHPESFYTQNGYYVIKYSGSGFAQSGGTKLADGYQIEFIISDGTIDIRTKAEEIVRGYLDRSKRLCAHNSWINMEPAPRNPQIWTDGPHYEILDFSKGYDGLNKYKCESAWNNILCSEWTYNKLAPGEKVACWK